MILNNSSEWTEQSGRVGVIHGIFDSIEPDTIKLINAAKKLCDTLVVLVCCDYWTERYVKKPSHKSEDRAFMMDSLKGVDFVCVFSDSSPKKMVSRLKPDFIIKPASEAGKPTGGDEGCEVVFVSIV